MSSIQDYFDAADNWERPRAASTNTPRHPPSASRTARHASSPGQRGPARSSREVREYPSSSQTSQSAARPPLPLQTTRGPRRSAQQNALPRLPHETPSRHTRDPYILARVDQERDELPPPPYEPLPSRTSISASQAAPPVPASSGATRASLEGMMAGLEVVEPPPISGWVVGTGPFIVHGTCLLTFLLSVCKTSETTTP
ncbi:hypothetical protein B0T14DRAFT_531754 [Immersiella caudata]|uniref:Uncharacterized protein n=1 Tax=Immersiella caudata TaxID=314043 RepID=A0AA39TP87_9PEZI|nr:hypothetical protein B0T14DRAFT_531754 [Immersiella caudata]